MDYLEALKNNPNLTDELKENMSFIMQKFMEKYPIYFGHCLDMNKIIKTLETINFKPMPKYLSNRKVKNEGSTTVLVNVDELKKDSSIGINELTRMLLTGLFPNNELELDAIHSGITDDIVNTLHGNNNSDEQAICNLLFEVLAPSDSQENPLYISYFRGDMASLKNDMEKKITPDKLNELLRLVNQNFIMVNPMQRVGLIEIQTRLIDIKFSQNPSSLEEIDTFGSFLVYGKSADEYCNDMNLRISNGGEIVHDYFQRAKATYLELNPQLKMSHEEAFASGVNIR